MDDEITIDEILEQLEDAAEAGQPIDVETFCERFPDIAAPLRQKWKLLQSFERNFITDDTHRSDSASSEPLRNDLPPEKTIKLQTQLRLAEFHDRGGLGDVFRCEDKSLNRQVAIKLLRADRQLANNKEDFQRESEIIGRMNHPGIVSVFGTGETIEGRPFYCMPFLEGGNLRARIQTYHEARPHRVVDSDKDFRDLIYRLLSACKTIAYAHSRGIVHRDIKPENILLGRYGETLIIDWGCATPVDRKDRFKVYGNEGTLRLDETLKHKDSPKALTLRFASPEQLHGKRTVGPESDIYGLGAALYLILAGQSPLEQVADEQIRAKVLGGQVPTPETLKAGIPRPLGGICAKAMSTEPEDRYHNALAMADDLERYLADEEVSACRSTVGMKMSRIVRRNRTASLLLLCTLMVSSFLLTIAFAGQSLFANMAASSARSRLRMAASLAANVGGFEIDRRLTALENQAADQTLLQCMQEIDRQPRVPEQWNVAQSTLYEFRDRLLAAGIQLESLYLTDSSGTQVARAPKSESVGKNFAFRHYFHGLDQDLDPRAADYNPPPPSTRPIVSNAYVSTNKDDAGQYPIKTSFSVPVLGREASGESRVLGRLGMSVRINQLSIFEQLETLDIDGVLIETKAYRWGTGSANGLILDRVRAHAPATTVPVNSVLNEDATREDQIQDQMSRLSANSLDALSSKAVTNGRATLFSGFFDPVVSEIERDAAIANLTIPHRPELRTGWTVLFIDRPLRE